MRRRRRYYDPKREYLFVDGYNILNQWEGYVELMVNDLEEARLRLADCLADYAHFTGIEVILVYDAYRVVKNMGTTISYKGIEVVFTKELETADHFIEREIAQMGRRFKNIRVATSDRLEQDLILAHGAGRISARELEIEVQNTNKQLQSKVTGLKIQNGKIRNGPDSGTMSKLQKMKKDLEE